MTDQTRFQLNESDLPKFWYNIYADSPVPPTPVLHPCLLYTSPSPRDRTRSRMPSSA